MISVDAFDLKMLAALQDDGRLTNQQLADLVGLSASQCSRRRMRLEEEKVIAGYHADLAGEALGFNLIAFIHITLATHSPDNAKKFRALVNRVDDIQEAYSLTGDADYVLKVVLRDLKDLSGLVNDVLMPHQSVAHVRSSIVLDRLKESAKLPLRLLAWPKSREIRHSLPRHDLQSWPSLQRTRRTMALQLRPNCEYCDKDLPPNAADARICSYECTFCADCVENKLHNVCPNCGGGFERRPIRPATERRPGVCVTKQLPSDKRVHLKYSVEDVAAHCARLKDIPPEAR